MSPCLVLHCLWIPLGKVEILFLAITAAVLMCAFLFYFIWFYLVYFILYNLFYFIYFI